MHDSGHADHARHDTMLIAGHAADDLSDRDRIAAEALLSSCEPCAALRRDLVAIAAATRALPSPAPARDFRLSPEQADRLRRGSWLRTLLRPFAAPGSAARPMAAAFTSLGIAGLFVAMFLPGTLGSAPSGGAGDFRSLSQGAAPSPAAAQPAASDREFAAVQASAKTDRAGATTQPVRVTSGGVGDANATASVDTTAAPLAAVGDDRSPTADAGTAAEDSRLRSLTPTTSPLLLGSLGLLTLGLLLFGLRIAARRLR